MEIQGKKYFTYCVDTVGLFVSILLTHYSIPLCTHLSRMTADPKCLKLNIKIAI